MKGGSHYSGVCLDKSIIPLPPQHLSQLESFKNLLETQKKKLINLAESITHGFNYDNLQFFSLEAPSEKCCKYTGSLIRRAVSKLAVHGEKPSPHFMYLNCILRIHTHACHSADGAEFHFVMTGIFKREEMYSDQVFKTLIYTGKKRRKKNEAY